MKVRDEQVKNLAFRRLPRLKQVCQYYADPALICTKRDTCSFEHPPLCRVPRCTKAECENLHIEGLDYSKWKNEEVVNPFKRQSPTIRQYEPCRHYLKGKCNYEDCKFPHPPPLMQLEDVSNDRAPQQRQIENTYDRDDNQCCDKHRVAAMSYQTPLVQYSETPNYGNPYKKSQLPHLHSQDFTHYANSESMSRSAI